MLVSDVEDAVNLGLFEIIDFGFFEILATMNVLVIWNHYHPPYFATVEFSAEPINYTKWRKGISKKSCRHTLKTFAISGSGQGGPRRYTAYLMIRSNFPDIVLLTTSDICLIKWLFLSLIAI